MKGVPEDQPVRLGGPHCPGCTSQCTLLPSCQRDVPLYERWTGTRRPVHSPEDGLRGVVNLRDEAEYVIVHLGRRGYVIVHGDGRLEDHAG